MAGYDTSASQGQPIIRGIHAVGGVVVKYEYLGKGNGTDMGTLKCPASITLANNQSEIKTKDGIEVAGFRLDSNFLDANPQIASSFMIPLLGGGAVALTNNNRSGVLTIASTRVSNPQLSGDNIGAMTQSVMPTKTSEAVLGADRGNVYDLSLLAQIQQSQPGGDSVGANITIGFQFAGKWTTLLFEACTVASVKPLTLSGNDAADYGVTFNYLNWMANYGSSTIGITAGNS